MVEDKDIIRLFSGTIAHIGQAQYQHPSYEDSFSSSTIEYPEFDKNLLLVHRLREILFLMQFDDHYQNELVSPNEPLPSPVPVSFTRDGDFLRYCARRRIRPRVLRGGNVGVGASTIWFDSRTISVVPLDLHNIVTVGYLISNRYTGRPR